MNIKQWFRQWRVRWFLHSIAVPSTPDTRLAYWLALNNLRLKANIEDPTPAVLGRTYIQSKRVYVNEVAMDIKTAKQTISKEELVKPDYRLPEERNLDDFLTSELGIPITPSQVILELNHKTIELVNAIEQSSAKNLDYYRRQYSELITEVDQITEALIMLALDNRA